MLTRLRVKGFKNLRDVEIRFGPLTCIAGPNGVGKSNLFDAITFLRDLTELSIVEAAGRVRDPAGRSDIRDLFTKTSDGSTEAMSFEADFIVSNRVVDDFGQKATPAATFLSYVVSFSMREMGSPSMPEILLESESLTYIPSGKAKERLKFPHREAFLRSVVLGRKSTPFISTNDSPQGDEELSEDLSPVIQLHADGGSRGLPQKINAHSSPKTILGGTNTRSHPTVLAAKREMQSWHFLQLEPSALRKPDDFSARPSVSSNGEHLPSTLKRLGDQGASAVASQLAEILPDVQEVYADTDEGRRLITLFVKGRDGIAHPARSLSDGTLRFLALSLIANDPQASGLICMEEPENGIHPKRIPVMLSLLQDLSVSTNEAIGDDNLMRQVIVNTHSPVVVQALPIDCLVVARPTRHRGTTYLDFSCIESTWRAQPPDATPTVPFGELISYLTGGRFHPSLVRDYKSVQQYMEQKQEQLQLELDESE